MVLICEFPVAKIFHKNKVLFHRILLHILSHIFCVKYSFVDCGDKWCAKWNLWTRARRLRQDSCYLHILSVCLSVCLSQMPSASQQGAGTSTMIVCYWLRTAAGCLIIHWGKGQLGTESIIQDVYSGRRGQTYQMTMNLSGFLLFHERRQECHMHFALRSVNEERC